MKKYFYLILALQLVLMADETIFSGGDIKYGGFGGPSVKNINLNGETMTIFGGGGAWAINDSISIGSYGYGRGDRNPIEYANKKYKKRYGFSGISIGYNLPTTSAFSPFASILVGIGNSTTGNTINNFSIINIDAGVQIKLFKWLRVAPNIGYSIITLREDSLPISDNFGGITYGVNFMFGKWNK